MSARAFPSPSRPLADRLLRTGVAAVVLLAASAIPTSGPRFRAELMAGDGTTASRCEKSDDAVESDLPACGTATPLASQELFGEAPSLAPDAEATGSISLAALSQPSIATERLPTTLPPQAEARPPTPRDELSAGFLSTRPAVPGVAAADLEIVRQALAEYRRGKLSEGDALAARAEDPGARLALEWAAIRLGRQSLGFARLARFSDANAAFPMADWVRRRAEEALFVEKRPARLVTDFFRQRAPEMAAGAVALARVLQQQGDEAGANALIRSAWRDKRTSAAIRTAMLKDFPEAVSAKDKQYLAEKMIYQGETTEGARIAAMAGPKAAALAQILAASFNETGGALAMIAKLDAADQGAPAAIFARAQHFRRANQPAAAAQALLHAPSDPEKIVDGDEWWIERRMLARKLLDAGDAETAYKIAAGHAAQGGAQRVDAEVHAGWIALRFLSRPEVAARHFAVASSIATAPASLSRAAYWRARAAEAVGDDHANDFYKDAAVHRHTYYGQLAAARLPRPDAAASDASPDMAELEEVTRGVGLKAIRVLLDVEARDLAQPLIADAASKSKSNAEAIAVGDLAARFGLPRLTLLAGKSAMQRGMLVKEHAFPTFGIPPYAPAPDSAEPAIVYSIARQESEFDAKAVSHAGARGLMQLMPATARRTAAKFKLPFDVNMLTADPSLNVRIGAAHLGELFGEYRGSYLLSFAAYNAGGGRVKEWINAYGDPRDPHVDKVDWVERIPIAETRHYVQKILENVQVYREMIDKSAESDISADLMRGARRGKFDLARSAP